MGFYHLETNNGSAFDDVLMCSQRGCDTRPQCHTSFVPNAAIKRHQSLASVESRIRADNKWLHDTGIDASPINEKR